MASREFSTQIKYNNMYYGHENMFPSGGYGSRRIETVNELPYLFKEFLISETDTNIFYEEVTFKFNIVDNVETFEEINTSKIFDFSKEEKRMLQSEIPKDFMNLTHEHLRNYIYKIFRNLNIAVARTLYNPSFYIDRQDSVSLKNLLKYADVEGALNLEKIISGTDSSTFFNLISNKNFEISKGRKLKQILEVPQSIINFLNENKISNCLSSFRIICSEDPNEGIYLVEYFKKLQKIKNFKPLKTEDYNVESFVSKLADIKMLVNVKLNVLIPYLIKQKAYYSMLQYQHNYYARPETRELFSIPVKETNTYYDYINNGGTELTPHILKIAHDSIVKNASFLGNKELSDKLSQRSQEFEKYVFSDKEYSITYPSKIEDLVNEGNLLCHCVASYSIPVAEGLTKVFFLRKNSEIDTPFVTIELDNDDNIVQIKEKYDLDVTDQSVMNFIKKWKKKFEI